MIQFNMESIISTSHYNAHSIYSIYTVYRNKILISGKLLWCKGNKTFWEVLLLLKYCIISYKVVPCTPLFLTSCKSPFIISAHSRNINFTTLFKSKQYFFCGILPFFVQTAAFHSFHFLCANFKLP